MIAPPHVPALERASAAPLTLVIGETDTGKTSLVTALAHALAARGHAVGVVDADLGQSEVGPPTTIGLGRARHPLQRLADAEVVALHFVGATSPAGNLLGTVVGVHRMVERARSAGFDRVLVDTSGLVAGELGRALKQAKIDLLRPDLVICLERGGECEPIVRPYQAVGRLRVLRLPVPEVVRRRSQEERRRHREQALERYFAGARTVELDLSRVVLRDPVLFAGEPLPPRALAAAGDAVGRAVLWGERRGADVVLVVDEPLGEAEARVLARRIDAGALTHLTLDDFTGVLAGLAAGTGDTLGLGVVEAVDFTKPALRVRTDVPVDAVVSVTIGRAKRAG